MRTTLQLTDACHSVARAYALRNNISLGEAVSEIILRNTPPAYFEKSPFGFPLFTSNTPLTVESVKELLEDE